MMRNRLYTKDEVIQVVEAALSALNNQSAPIQDVNGKLYLSHYGENGNEYLSHPTKPL